jgi:hypothetical protein
MVQAAMRAPFLTFLIFIFLSQLAHEIYKRHASIRISSLSRLVLPICSK